MMLPIQALFLSSEADFEEALEQAARDASLFSTYGTLFVVAGAVLLMTIVSIVVFMLVRPDGRGHNLRCAMISVVVVLLLFLLGFVIYTIFAHNGPHGDDKAKGPEPNSSHTEPKDEKETPIPPYSLVCTVGNDMNETTVFPEDGLCDYIMLEVLPVRLGGPYPKRVEHFLDVASKHRRTEYGMGFDSDSHAPVEESLTDPSAKNNLENLNKNGISHFGFMNTDIYQFNETSMAYLLGLLKIIIGLLVDKENSDRQVYTFVASAWKALSMAKEVSAEDATNNFKKVLMPDLFISIGHYAFHDINMLEKCRLLPATYLQPPQLDSNEQYKYTFGLESATKHVTDIDKLRDKGVEAPSLSVSVGLYGRWHYVDQKAGTKLEDHRPGSQCRPVVNETQKTGIYEVCTDSKYQILDDDKFHCKFTLGKTYNLQKVMVFDTTETLRYKVCSSKKTAAAVKYGITAAQLEYADSSGHCKNGTFPLVRALKQIVKFFKHNYTSEANFENCVALRT